MSIFSLINRCQLTSKHLTFFSYTSLIWTCFLFFLAVFKTNTLSSVGYFSKVLQNAASDTCFMTDLTLITYHQRGNITSHQDAVNKGSFTPPSQSCLNFDPDKATLTRSWCQCVAITAHCMLLNTEHTVCLHQSPSDSSVSTREQNIQINFKVFTTEVHTENARQCTQRGFFF